MWILLTIYALMGSLLSIYLRKEMNWDVGDCLFAGIAWPVFLLASYIQYIRDNN